LQKTPHPVPPKLHALLATARIANVPSVISNVCVGVMFAIHITPHGYLISEDVRLSFPYQDMLTVIVSACLLYVSGNFLNDWHDVDWDRKHRPERALPVGYFLGLHFFLIALCFWLIGGILASFVNMSTLGTYLGISIFVMAYTRWHKKSSFSIWIMGACRAGLYLLGFFAICYLLEPTMLTYLRISPILLALAFSMIGLHSYIAGLSLYARRESLPADVRPSGVLPFLLLSLPLLTHSCVWIALASTGQSIFSAWMLLPPIPFAWWLITTLNRDVSLSQKVSRLLAGIPLVDFISLGLALAHFHYTSSRRWGNAHAEIILPDSPLMVVLVVTPFLAFLLALLLQKLAPAT
jgi:hypothetical protein